MTPIQRLLLIPECPLLFFRITLKLHAMNSSIQSSARRNRRRRSRISCFNSARRKWSRSIGFILPFRPYPRFW